MSARSVAAAVFGGDELGRLPLRALSLALMLAALACAWVPHRRTTLMLWHSDVAFTPDFVSGALSLAVIAPLYARRLIAYPHHSLGGVVFFVVNLALTATLMQILLGKGSAFGTLPSYGVITGAILLSWLGLRAAARLAWLALLVFAVAGAMFGNDEWGLAGFAFVVCGFCGVLLQTPLTPAALVAEIGAEYGGQPRPLPSTDRARLPPWSAETE